MWVIDFGHWTLSPLQLYVSAASALVLGLYAFTMPACPPVRESKNRSLLSTLGLDAFVLFKKRRMAVFFFFAMLLGAALQITNTFGGTFLEDFKVSYADSFGVRHPNLLLSISQISETLFILTIPFFFSRFGIKRVMIISIFAWVLRFGLFGIGNPGDGLILLVLSMIIYGMAFDFFNISGSLFVETNTDSSIRASAQGLFMMMTNGVGAFLGSKISGYVIGKYFILPNGNSDWHGIWISFAIYALAVAILFMILFKHKHVPKISQIEKAEAVGMTPH